MSKVGYKNPPKEHQWLPGQSGNPQGRPRKDANPASDNFTDIIHQIIRGEVNQAIAVTGAKGVTKMPAFQAAFRKLMIDAIGGKVSAFRALIRMIEGTIEHGQFKAALEPKTPAQPLLTTHNPVEAERHYRAFIQAADEAASAKPAPPRKRRRL